MNQSASEDKKVLWVNPSFLDYRIPLYGELNKKLNGGFHLLYSKERIPERCHEKINEILKDNAHYLESEKRLTLGHAESEFANKSVSIPIPRGLYKKIKDVKPDAIIAEGFFQFTPWAVWYSFFHRKPLYIAYERTAHTERNCPWWRKLYRRIVGIFVNGYIANGMLTKEYLISQGVDTKKIFTGGMCADSANLRKLSGKTSIQDKRDFENSIGLKACNGIRYIFVGRIIELKGINHLLDSWRIHIQNYNEDELLIVGDGDKLKQYRTAYSDLCSVKFLGGVDYSQIYKYYSISNVFIIPTLEDNWSLVVPEAMACGLPIACSIYNGCHPELVKQDFNGTVFDPLHTESIVKALDYFHKVDITGFGENSSKLELEYSPENTADHVLEMLNNV